MLLSQTAYYIIYSSVMKKDEHIIYTAVVLSSLYSEITKEENIVKASKTQDLQVKHRCVKLANMQ